MSRQSRAKDAQFTSFGLKLFAFELFGTFSFVFLAQAAHSSFELTGTINDTLGRQLASLYSAGLALLLATTLTVAQTGAHLNPAISLASCLVGRLKFARALKYVMAHYCGALLAAAAINATFHDKIHQRHSEGLLLGANATLRAHGSPLSTGRLFTSFPPSEVSLGQLFVSYTLASSFFSLLLLVVLYGWRHELAELDIPVHAKPVFAAAALVLVQSAFAANGGPVLNPAQDLAPRLYMSLAGWGSAAFSSYHYNYWWLCALLAPHLGAILGACVYRLLSSLAKAKSSAEILDLDAISDSE